MRPGLVFVTRALEVPPTSGGPIRTHRLIVGLAERFDVSVVTMEHRPGSVHEPADAAALRPWLPPDTPLTTVPGLGPGKRASQLASLPRPRSYEFGRYGSPALAAALRRTIAEHRPAAVHYDDLGVALLGPVGGVRNFYSTHNVEHRILSDAAAAAPSALRRFYLTREAAKAEREERRAWAAMDLVVAVSELDAAAMRAGGARAVVVAPNGTDEVEQLPLAPLSGDEPLRLLFVGNCAYWPNEHGLGWFTGEVLPRLRETTAVRFDVVGEPPHTRPGEGGDVVYHGRVPDLEPWYRQAHAVVVPLFLGSGTRLKVVEAMAYGRPVVSTTLGAEGLGLRPGAEFLAADEAAAFAAALGGLAERLRAGDLPSAMVAAARTAASRLFWPAVTAAMAEDYAAAIDGRPAEP